MKSVVWIVGCGGEFENMFSRAARPSRTLAAAALIVWLALIGAWTAILWRHQSTPGEPAVAPAVWPLSSRLVRKANHFTLVAFTHPKCPCVRATIDELRDIEAQFNDRVQVIVVCCSAAGVAEGEIESWDAYVARTAPRSEVFPDVDQREAASFDARTSGEVMLYRPDGRLAFHGGITAGRGHAGPNQGASSVVQSLEGSDCTATAAVFGCPLRKVREDR